MLKFVITVEKTIGKKLSEEQLRDQLKFIGDSAKRSSTNNWIVSIPKKLIREVETEVNGTRMVKYTAVIQVSKERYKSEEAVRLRWEKTKQVMERAARRKDWSLLSDEALVASVSGEYVVVNGAGEPTGDPAPRLLANIPPKVSPFLLAGAQLPALNEQVMDSFFSRIYERDAHIRIIYDNLKIAVKTGFKTRHHLLLKGPPACISGDAVLELNRAGKSFKLSLESFYRRYNGIMEGEHGNARWDKAIPTKIRAMDSDGCLRLYDVAGVIDSGIKETVSVRTEDGKNVRSTLDHRFYTPDGWKPLSEIKEGDLIAVDGGPAVASGKKWRRAKYLEKEGLRHHPFANRKNTGRYSVRVHRLVIEADRNGLSFDDYVKRLRNGSIDGLVFLDHSEIVHHKDNNQYNNNLDNLEVKSRKGHSQGHGFEDRTHRHFVASRKWVKVTSIDDKRVEHVYDVQLATEPHNFLANGIVVHNCAKTEMFLAFIDWLGEDLVETIDGGTMTKAGLERLLLGKAESKTLKPILLLEEIEKCHPDNLACLIQVMDARGKIQRVNADTVRNGGGVADCRPIVWGTCNDEEELKKAHKGAIWSRFSAKMDCQRPDRALMRKILLREVAEIGGKPEWVEPVLSFCFDELQAISRFKDDYDDPRFARAMLVGGDRLLDLGSKGFFADFRYTNKIKAK